MGYLRSALAGAAAAGVWAAVEPLDKPVFDVDYSDVAFLGKAFTTEPGWPAAGLAVHLANGALFGVAFEAARRRVPVGPRKLALALALAEHVALFPLAGVAEKRHPARGEPGVAPIVNKAGFAQATWRHALFGVVLGRLAG